MTLRNDATRLRVPQRDKRMRRGVVARQGQVLLDADLNQQGDLLLGRVEAEARALMGSPGKLVYPAGTTGFAIGAAGTPLAVTIGAGEGYLDGWRLENPDGCNLASQPHPFTPAPNAPVLIALRAAVRHIDPVEERAMADVALGDAQAPGRALNDWQVLPVPLTTTNPLTDPAWTAIKAASTGKLAFRRQQPSGPTDICSLTPQGGYSRHENLLYRVEVHGGVAAETHADGPRYGLNGLKLKFSRRNASIMARVIGISGNKITVAPPPFDERTWFAPGSYAELVSIHDDANPSGLPAAERLFKVSTVDGADVFLQEGGGATVAATGAAPPATPAEEANWFLRCWDTFPVSGGTSSGIATVALAANGTDSLRIDLGDGLAVELTGGAAARFRRGDYWTCAVRADGTVAWADGALANVAEAPHGPEIRYAPLAHVTASGVTDLRIPLATLTDRTLLYRGGDGQMAPGTASGLARLPAMLRVAVMRGETPVAGAPVRWRILAPTGTGGRLEYLAQTGANLVVPTNDQGISEVAWSIDAAQPTALHQVSADLDDGPQPGTPPLLFSAGFDREGSHGGCSTYVIPEGSDWVTLLEQMDFSQDIAVCFQRGEYRTSRPVVLSGTRSIKISGAGDGTLLLARHGETVLRLEGFASAVVERLRIETRDSLKLTNRKANGLSGRGGALTLQGCLYAEVRNTALRCGGALATERTALTSAGTEERPVSVARVIDNRIIAGFLQDGVLVVNCRDSTVAGNQLVAGKRSAKLGAKAVSDAKAWKLAVVRALVSRIKFRQRPGTNPELRGFRLGRVTVEFASAAPQADWDALAVLRPWEGGDNPTEAEALTYLEALVDTAMRLDAEAPEAVRALLKESERRGARFDPAGKRTMALAAMLPSGVKVSDARRPRPDRGALKRLTAIENGLRLGAMEVTFESPIPHAVWAQLYNDDTVYRPGRPRHATDLARQVRAMAMLLASDATVRNRFSAVAGWYGIWAEPAEAAARQAITCGGAVLENVAVTGNRVRGYACGVHVGVSARVEKGGNGGKPRDGTRTALNARIADNDLALQLPSGLHYYPAGLFLGNARTGRIDRNVLSRSDGMGDNGGWRHGIRVWGLIGNYLMIAENRIAGPRIGIKVRPTNMAGSQPDPQFLWVARDNLVDWVPVGNVLHAPALVQNRDNRPV
ncbi:MAG TPA: DUF6519 domain-containing protein [Novosphingobium sp.]|nr:DUF6519 domain-containing protein [Novosphingobium sp.]